MKEIDTYDSLYVSTILATGYSYRQTDCYNVCYQEHLVRKCHCYTLTTPYWAKNTTKPCLNITQVTCDADYFGVFFSQDVASICDVKCPRECDSVTYGVSKSSSDYPSNVYASMLLTNPTVTSKYPNASLLTYDYLKKTILSVQVYYEELSYNNFIELEKTTVTDLISSIGGTMGLFLGVSFLSFVEILDLLIQIVFAFFFTKYSNDKIKRNKISSVNIRSDSFFRSPNSSKVVIADRPNDKNKSINFGSNAVEKSNIK